MKREHSTGIMSLGINFKIKKLSACPEHKALYKINQLADEGAIKGTKG